MQTFEQWVAQQKIESGEHLNRETIKSLLSDAFNAGAANMLECCTILQDNAERNRVRDRYIASRVHPIPTERH